jgi:D-alanine-D-alanine ligase
VGEVVPHAEFYSYSAKYVDENGAALIIPADLTADQAAVVRDLALRAFAALDLEGMARVDFFLDSSDGAIYVNEVNTIPGFTEHSMYPKLWEASGLGFAQVLDRLIALALERHRERSALVTRRDEAR